MNEVGRMVNLYFWEILQASFQRYAVLILVIN